MTQVNSSVLLYSQAIALLQQLKTTNVDGTTQNLDDIATQLQTVLTQYEMGVTKPLLQFSKFVVGEPPLSSKINDMWTNATTDLNILANQVDILQAASTILHNNIKTEILQLTNENAAIANKLSALALFSNANDSKSFTFIDSFQSSQFIDYTQPDCDAQIDEGFLTLANQGDLVNLTAAAAITIDPISNGILGNNQEIEDPTAAILNPITGVKDYVFVGQINPANNLAYLTDNLPSTWIEYEMYQVSTQDQIAAERLNFVYANSTTISSSAASLFDWADGPTNNVLDMIINIDLGSIQAINYINYNPYGLENNNNNPVLIKKLRVSADNTIWQDIVTTPIWVGTITDLQTAQIAANASIGSISWTFQVESAQFISIEIQQPNPIPCNIGHLYYQNTATGLRVQGPIPPTTNPGLYYNQEQSSVNNYQKKVEYFQGKRWAIGIKDLTVQQVAYSNSSTMVSQSILVGGTVSRVALDANVYVPPSFGSSQQWVQFYISPDNGTTWYQIARIQDNVAGVSEILAFNDPLPAAFRDPNVTYITTTNPVTSLKTKIMLAAPPNVTTMTPVVKDYALKIRLA